MLVVNRNGTSDTIILFETGDTQGIKYQISRKQFDQYQSENEPMDDVEKIAQDFDIFIAEVVFALIEWRNAAKQLANKEADKGKKSLPEKVYSISQYIIEKLTDPNTTRTEKLLFLNQFGIVPTISLIRDIAHHYGEHKAHKQLMYFIVYRMTMPYQFEQKAFATLIKDDPEIAQYMQTHLLKSYYTYYSVIHNNNENFIDGGKSVIYIRDIDNNTLFDRSEFNEKLPALRDEENWYYGSSVYVNSGIQYALSTEITPHINGQSQYTSSSQDNTMSWNDIRNKNTILIDDDETEQQNNFLLNTDKVNTNKMSGIIITPVNFTYDTDGVPVLVISFNGSLENVIPTALLKQYKEQGKPLPFTGIQHSSHVMFIPANTITKFFGKYQRDTPEFKKEMQKFLELLADYAGITKNDNRKQFIRQYSQYIEDIVEESLGAEKYDALIGIIVYTGDKQVRELIETDVIAIPIIKNKSFELRKLLKYEYSDNEINEIIEEYKSLNLPQWPSKFERNINTSNEEHDKTRHNNNGFLRR